MDEYGLPIFRSQDHNVAIDPDASGNWSRMATDLSIARTAQAGVIPIDTLAVITEMQRTWNRPDAMDFGNLLADYFMPHYRLLFERHK